MEKETTKNEIFFSKKRIIFIIFFLLLVISLITITIIFVIAPEIDINLISKSLEDAFRKRTAKSIMLLLVLLSFVFAKCFGNVFPIIMRLKKINIKLTFWDICIYSFFYSFIVLISPSSLLTDPYTIYWIRKKGVPYQKASAITLNYDFIYTLAIIFLSWPSVIYFACDGSLSNLMYGDHYDKVIFWFIFVGMAIDICALLFLFIFGFSKRIHVFVSKTFNKIRKTFKLSYLTKTEIIDKYKINAVMKREFLSSLKDWKTSLSAFIILLTLSFYSYLCLYICVQMLNNDSSYVVKFMNVFSSANIANTANKFIPLPSGEGGIEICLIRTLTAGDSIFKNGNSIDDDYTKLLINSSSLLWRIFTVFLPALIGIVFGIAEIKAGIKKSHTKSSHNKN